MAAVFHAPMAGALFVCEIVIGIMSMDMLAPLLVGELRELPHDLARSATRIRSTKFPARTST